MNAYKVWQVGREQMVEVLYAVTMGEAMQLFSDEYNISIRYLEALKQ